MDGKPGFAGKNLKPYQGLKLLPSNPLNLSGIGESRKKPKTLSGIETLNLQLHATPPPTAGKNLKPYQGLKQVTQY